MTLDEFLALPQLPDPNEFDYEGRVIEGGVKVRVPKQRSTAVLWREANDPIEFIDPEGTRWEIGRSAGALVRRKALAGGPGIGWEENRRSPLDAVPILLNHDPKAIIGTATPEDEGTLLIEIARDVPPITKEAFDAIFGGAGYQVLQFSITDEVVYIRKARIFEFSFCQAPPAELASSLTGG